MSIPGGVVINVDAIVIGFSVAGVGAALRLAKSGVTSTIVPYPADTLSIAGTWSIGPTPINRAPVDGAAFERLAEELLRLDGTEIWRPGTLDEFRVLPDGEGVSIGGANRSVVGRAVVCAFNGTERGFNPSVQAERFYGHGVSFDAWSDSEFFTGQPVVVAGSGLRVFEQAMMASRFADTITVVIDAADAGTVRHAADHNHFELITGSVEGLQGDSTGHLSAVVLLANGQSIERPARALFAAHEPIPSWNFIQQRSEFQVCGVAAGVAHWRHGVLFADGERAARSCLEHLAARR